MGMKWFNRERRAYIEALLVLFVLVLFLTAHYLHTITVLDKGNNVWMGMNVGNLFTDITLYSAGFLTVILFILILHRNFIVRGKKEKNMSFLEYKGDKSCIICGSYENLIVNQNDKQDLELVLCENCINGYKIALKTS